MNVTNTTAAEIIPLYERAEEWAWRMNHVRGARHFIYAMTYFCEYDEYGVAWLEVLREAHQRGVRVTLIIDAFGQKLSRSLMTPESYKKLLNLLKSLAGEGMVVQFYDAPRRLQRLFGAGNHIKFQICDDGWALFGSSNISRTSYNQWDEFSVAIKGHAVSIFLADFFSYMENLSEEHKKDIDLLDSLSPPASYGLTYYTYNPNQNTGLLGPLDWKQVNPITDYLVQLCNQAERSIQLTSFYYKPAPRLAKALERAAKRGVSVAIYHSHSDALPATDLPWLSSWYHYRTLFKNNVSVFENKKGQHAKIILVDDKTAVFGTYNLEYAAHDRLAEAMLVSEHPQIIEQIQTVLEKIASNKDNIAVKESALSSLPVSLQVKAILLWPFRRWV